GTQPLGSHATGSAAVGPSIDGWATSGELHTSARRSLGATKMDEAILNRITADPEIFGGKPIIRGMRISVELILSLLAQGESMETILADYPDLEPDDLRACLAYAHAAISHDKFDSLQITA